MPESSLVPLIASLNECYWACFGPELKRLGWSLGTFQLLTAVHAAGANASQVEVAERLGITPATLSESVHALCQKGLLEQLNNPKDRRKRTLRLTPAATKPLNSLRATMSQVEKNMTQGLSESEIKTVQAILGRMNQNLTDFLDTK